MMRSWACLTAAGRASMIDLMRFRTCSACGRGPISGLPVLIEQRVVTRGVGAHHCHDPLHLSQYPLALFVAILLAPGMGHFHYKHPIDQKMNVSFQTCGVQNIVLRSKGASRSSTCLPSVIAAPALRNNPLITSRISSSGNQVA